MIFGCDGFLVTPYQPLFGNQAKNDVLLAACQTYPERFLVSARSGDPRAQVAALVTDPRNACWEVWRDGAFVGILLLDRIVAGIDARWQFVFFDDDLQGKTALLREFARRCFHEAGLHRLTIEAPEHMSVLLSYARKALGFAYEGKQPSRREQAYHDGTRWRDVVTLRLFAEEAL